MLDFSLEPNIQFQNKNKKLGIRMASLFQELKRRKVFRVAVAYAVVAWVLIQISGEVLPALQMPQWTVSFVTVLLILGFPVAILLGWAFELTPDGVSADTGAASPPVATSSADRKLIYAIFALVLLVVGFQLSDRFFAGNVNNTVRSTEPTQTPADSTVLRSSIILNQPLPEFPGLGIRTQLSIAPDGSALTYSTFAGVIGKILLRDLATQQTREIFSEISTQQLSPNGQQLLLYSPLTLVASLMSAQGGVRRTLRLEAIGVPSWLTDETLVYRHIDGMKIFSLTDASDDLIPGFDNSAGNAGNFRLPNDSAFLFTQGEGSFGSYRNLSILTHDLNTQRSKLVITDGYYPKYVNSGHIVFIRGGDLWAVPFDPEALEITGTEKIVIDGVASTLPVGEGAYSVSDSGRLVYLPGREYTLNQTVLVWADRLGNRTELPLRAGNYQEPRFSPDGEFLALTSFQPDGSSDIWVHNFSSGTFTPVTFAGNARSPVWTPDGSQLVYQLNTVTGAASGAPRGELWIMNANGTGQAERILGGLAKPDSFSPFDEKLIYFIGGNGPGDPINLSILTNINDAWISDPFFHTEGNTWGARVSPDGRWIAYGSSGSSSTELPQIYVKPYPNLDGGRWRISSDLTYGSREPSWGPDGDELFFLQNDGSLMASKITIEGDSFSSGVPQQLLTNMNISGSSPLYIVSNDGERFLHGSAPLALPNSGIDQDYTELIVVENWFQELNRLAPPDLQ